MSNAPSRQRRRHAAVASLWGGCLLLAAGAASAFDTQPAEGVLKRLLPRQAGQFELGTLESTDGRERFRFSADQGRIRIAGTTPSALLFGAGWYLKYVAHAHFSESGDRIPTGALPLPAEPIEMATPFPWRYALNENVDGYTAPYWDFARWERELVPGADG